jgi:hypothetical protein
MANLLRCGCDNCRAGCDKLGEQGIRLIFFRVTRTAIVEGSRVWHIAPKKTLTLSSIESDGTYMVIHNYGFEATLRIYKIACYSLFFEQQP